MCTVSSIRLLLLLLGHDRVFMSPNSHMEIELLSTGLDNYVKIKCNKYIDRVRLKLNLESKNIYNNYLNPKYHDIIMMPQAKAPFLALKPTTATTHQNTLIL